MMASSQRLVCFVFLLVVMLIFHETSAFTTTTTTLPVFSSHTYKAAASSPFFRLNAAASSAKKSRSSSSSSSGGSSLLSNPFKKLPWNVQKEKERQARRLKQERNILHRQLGIAEDATYEEIVDATNLLISKAGDDLKAKIRIEVAKDKILQIRLNERLAGLTLSETNREARAQSSYEVEGSDDDDDDKSQAAKEWNAPGWTKGLIVKPDTEHLKGQVRLWGIVTMIGVVFPPAQDYMGRFTWLVCVAQLTFRGMPREQQERGGMGISFGGSGGGGHRKVAFALGFSTWVIGATLVYSLMPTWAKGQRWTASLGFAMQNLIFAAACSYLQPYKGK